MRVKKTKHIPAQPEHIISAQPARTETYDEDICDVCKTHRAHRDCAICGRDACKGCLQYDPRDNSDYPGDWCPHCLQLWHDKYEALNRTLEGTYDTAWETMRTAWKAQSLAIGAEKAGKPETPFRPASR